MLILKNICINNTAQSNPRLITNLNVTIPSGEIKALMGPSGSGKSTLLNFLLGHLEPPFAATGDIELFGTHLNNVTPHLRQLGILFQSGMLFPHLTVYENISYAIPENLSKADKKAKVLDLLENVGLCDLITQMPHELSGGQYIRVALMRTIAANPKALLLDEPFSRLDAVNRDSVRQWLFDYIKKKNIPVLLVTHDKDDVIATGHHAIQI